MLLYTFLCAFCRHSLSPLPLIQDQVALELYILALELYILALEIYMVALGLYILTLQL